MCSIECRVEGHLILSLMMICVGGFQDFLLGVGYVGELSYFYRCRWRGFLGCPNQCRSHIHERVSKSQRC